MGRQHYQAGVRGRCEQGKGGMFSCHACLDRYVGEAGSPGSELVEELLGIGVERLVRAAPPVTVRQSRPATGMQCHDRTAVAPGIGFGEHGDDHVRIALVENEQRIRQAARNVRRFFETADRTLHNVVPIARAV